ncbi:MAG: hypothetical protein Q8O91_12350 [Candidatus Aminicenantes bacterium]|nr:hypothetical protein [Candidatus Aminicenantes bacterium]
MYEKITILLIEDARDEAETIKDSISKKIPGVCVEIESDFKKANLRVEEVLPDMVVLDLFEDPSEPRAGYPVWEKIWRVRFCPLVFHTAHEKPEEPAVPSDHPFVKFVQKRRGSYDEVADHLLTFMPHIKAIQNVNREIAIITQNVLRDVTTPIWAAQPKSPEREDILIRAAKRRVAAMMDLGTIGGEKPMQAWERYVVPALGSDLLTGDILREVGGNADKPASYRLILSPSCDMVKARPRLGKVLAAKCKEIKDFLNGAQVGETPSKEQKRRLKTALTKEQCGGYIPLPGLPKIVPVMAVCLRELELIPIGTIGNAPGQDVSYVRIASVDSPFRERIAWAYLQISGRPGIPECDLEAFIESIIKA